MRIKPILLSIVLLLAFNSLSFADTLKIKIGVVTDLTGPANLSGNDLKDTILFANKTLGKDRYELIFEDEKCNAKDAVTIAHRLVNIDKVDAVIGFACSGSIIASASIYEKAKIPVIISSASSPQIPGLGKYIFHLSINDKFAGEVLGKYISKQKETIIGAISANTEYCQDIKNVLTKNLDRSKLQFYYEDYNPGETDYKSYLLRLKSKKVESLFVNTQAETGVSTIYKQLREMNWAPKLYQAYYPSGDSLQKLMGNELEGTEYVDTVSLKDILNSKGSDLLLEYKKEYRNLRSYELIFATTFEAFNALNQAILARDSQKTISIKDFLENTEINGIFGKYKFDANHSITGLNFEMKKIQGGKVVRITD